MTLPPLPKDRDWSEATWRAGLDEAVRLSGCLDYETWDGFSSRYLPRDAIYRSIIAHATTLLDAAMTLVPEGWLVVHLSNFGDVARKTIKELGHDRL